MLRDAYDDMIDLAGSGACPVPTAEDDRLEDERRREHTRLEGLAEAEIPQFTSPFPPADERIIVEMLRDAGLDAGMHRIAGGGIAPGYRRGTFIHIIDSWRSVERALDAAEL